MRRSILAFGIILLLLISGCNPRAEEEIKVGVVAPLTGDFGTYGNDVQRGISLALEGGGFENVEVIYEDACLPGETSNAINKLVSLDSVDLVSGVFCIVSVEPILALADLNDINVMMVASVPDDFVGISENLFSSHFVIRDEARAQAEFAFNTLGARKSAILYLNNAFGTSYEKNFLERFEELGGENVAEEKLDIYAGDFRTPITKIKAKEPDVTLVVHLGTELGLILKQAKELDLDSIMIGTYEAEDASVLTTAGDAAEEFLISSPSIVYEGVVSEFRDKFNDKYGEFPTVIAQNAYDAIKLQVDAFKECSGDNICIRDKLKSTRNYQGVSGTFDISPNGTATKTIIFKEVKNGRFVNYEDNT